MFIHEHWLIYIHIWKIGFIKGADREASHQAQPCQSVCFISCFRLNMVLCRPSRWYYGSHSSILVIQVRLSQGFSEICSNSLTCRPYVIGFACHLQLVSRMCLGKCYGYTCHVAPIRTLHFMNFKPFQPFWVRRWIIYQNSWLFEGNLFMNFILCIVSPILWFCII